MCTLLITLKVHVHNSTLLITFTAHVHNDTLLITFTLHVHDGTLLIIFTFDHVVEGQTPEREVGGLKPTSAMLCP